MSVSAKELKPVYNEKSGMWDLHFRNKIYSFYFESDAMEQINEMLDAARRRHGKLRVYG